MKSKTSTKDDDFYIDIFRIIKDENLEKTSSSFFKEDIEKFRVNGYGYKPENERYHKINSFLSNSKEDRTPLEDNEIKKYFRLIILKYQLQYGQMNLI
ncbi:MAG: hypothetical protein KA080_03740 [Leptotrichiaceae bacterium]|nr:hypothetical protein [Leptotrichiaceae bacterium]